MKYSKTCHHCDQKVNAFTHNLNKKIVECFIKFIDRYREIQRPININREFSWSHDQLANFRKLKFFKLIKKTDDNGFWEPTTLGVEFYYGESGVMNPVGTMSGEVIGADHPAWETHTKPRRLTFITDVEESHFKQRQEYKDEASGGYSQDSLF